MKKTSLDTRIIASTPKETSIDNNFTERTMHKIYTSKLAAEGEQDTHPQKKHSFFMQLRHLPKIATFALVITAIGLFSGTAYAAYKFLWEQPHVIVQDQTTNQFGRSQNIASLQKCGDQSSETIFETKSGNSLGVSEISKILQARCEMAVIQDWAGENSSQPNAENKPAIGTSTSSMVMLYPTAGRVASISEKELSLTGDVHLPDKPLTLSLDTQYIVDHALVSYDNIQPGDSVLFIQNITTQDKTTKNENNELVTSGTPTSRQVTHVIKLDLPFEYYNSSKQDQVARRQTCAGNSQDSCIQSQFVDMYRSAATNAPGSIHTIQGIIIEHNGKELKLRSSSGRIFALAPPSDVIVDFNKSKGANYDNVRISEGDLLQVRYVTEKSPILNLDTSQIMSIELILNPIRKGEPVKKY